MRPIVDDDEVVDAALDHHGEGVCARCARGDRQRRNRGQYRDRRAERRAPGADASTDVAVGDDAETGGHSDDDARLTAPGHRRRGVPDRRGRCAPENRSHRCVQRLLVGIQQPVGRHAGAGDDRSVVAETEAVRVFQQATGIG
ncbi:MAG TPA: hypothetical protein VGE11_04215 [Pseudonocardia sp.]